MQHIPKIKRPFQEEEKNTEQVKHCSKKAKQYGLLTEQHRALIKGTIRNISSESYKIGRPESTYKDTIDSEKAIILAVKIKDWKDENFKFPRDSAIGKWQKLWNQWLEKSNTWGKEILKAEIKKFSKEPEINTNKDKRIIPFIVNNYARMLVIKSILQQSELTINNIEKFNQIQGKQNTMEDSN